MNHDKKVIFLSHSAKDTELIRLLKLTFINRNITPYFASRSIEGKNPVEKILRL